MHREIIFATETKLSIKIPKKMIGKKIEVIFNEIKTKSNNFFDDIEPIYDFPSQNEIRKQA